MRGSGTIEGDAGGGSVVDQANKMATASIPISDLGKHTTR